MTSAAFTQHLHPAQTAAREMDGVMIFGFCVALIALVFLLYKDEFKVRLPVLVVSFGAAATYGFLQGAWPLGILLCGLTARELLQWWRGSVPIARSTTVKRYVIGRTSNGHESRMSRMFGV